MGIILNIINIQRLKRKLNDLEKVSERREVIRKASRAAARPLLSEIKSTTAYKNRTGLLRSSIKIRASKKSRVRVGVNIIIRVIDWQKALAKGLVKDEKRRRKRIPKTYKAFYGQFIELGTSRIKARKFMKTPAKKMKTAIQEDMIKRTFQLIKDIVK
jgi:HK97 gp10 family phage protein